MAHIGKLRFNYRGLWVASTQYFKDDVVYYKGNTYIANANTASSVSPLTRLDTNSDNLGTAGTDWTLYDTGGLGGNGNRGSEGFANNVMTNVLAHSRATNSFWRAGTYYHGDAVVFQSNNAVHGTYRVKTASTTLPPANTTANPTSGWDRIAHGNGNSAKLGFVHPGSYYGPWPNVGYIKTVDWAGAAGVWNGDIYGYACQSTTQYHQGWFVNQHQTLTETPGFRDANAPTGTQVNSGNHEEHSGEVSFSNLDYLDGVLATPDGEHPKITQMMLYRNGCLVLFNNGEVHYSGRNTEYQAGDGTADRSLAGFVRCGYANVNRTGATTVLRGKKAIRIASSVCNAHVNGGYSNYALVDNLDGSNTLYQWGENAYGQASGGGSTADVQVPTALTWDAGTNGKIVDVWATGGSLGKVIVLTATGKMFGWGYNRYSGLGTGSLTSSGGTGTYGLTTPTLIKDWSGEGGIRKFSWGNSSTGYGMGAVVSGNGKLWTWGENASGNLGNGGTTDVNTPTQIGSDTDWKNCWVFERTGTVIHFFATKGSSDISNDLYACGDAQYYVLGQSTPSETDVSTLGLVYDSYGTKITNVVNVLDLKKGQSYFLTGIEKYIGPTEFTNQGWYKTRWYVQGNNTGGGLGIRGNGTYNIDVEYLPSKDVSGTNEYFMHSNAFNPVGVSPYRNTYCARGYSSKTVVMQMDRDTGRMYTSGELQYGLDSPFGNRDSNTRGSGITDMTPQPLPYN